VQRRPMTGAHRIDVAGHRGMVGSAIVRRLQALGRHGIVTATHAPLDLTDAAAVRAFFATRHIDHVVPALIRRFHEAVLSSTPEVVVWGSSVDRTIRKLSETIAGVTRYSGRLVWDRSKPDDTARKLMDASGLAALGWRSRIGLEDSLRDACRWFVDHPTEARL
jgi:nucleoside-diphosphate-sugar epimerase